MLPRKFLAIVAAIAAAIGLVAMSVFAIVVGVVAALAIRVAFWASKPKTNDTGMGDDGMVDGDGMVDITAQGRVL